MGCRILKKVIKNADNEQGPKRDNQYRQGDCWLLKEVTGKVDLIIKKAITTNRGRHNGEG